MINFCYKYKEVLCICIVCVTYNFIYFFNSTKMNNHIIERNDQEHKKGTLYREVHNDEQSIQMTFKYNIQVPKSRNNDDDYESSNGPSPHQSAPSSTQRQQKNKLNKTF